MQKVFVTNMSTEFSDIKTEIRQRADSLGLKTEGDQEDESRLNKHAVFLKAHRQGNLQTHYAIATSHGHLYENYRNTEMDDDLMNKVARNITKTLFCDTSSQFSPSQILGKSLPFGPLGLFITDSGKCITDLETLHGIINPTKQRRIKTFSIEQSDLMIHKLFMKAKSDSKRFILVLCVIDKIIYVVLVDVITPHSLYIYHAIQ